MELLIYMAGGTLFFALGVIVGRWSKDHYPKIDFKSTTAYIFGYVSFLVWIASMIYSLVDPEYSVPLPFYVIMGVVFGFVFNQNISDIIKGVIGKK